MFKFSKSKNVNFAELYHKVENIYNDLPQVKKIRRKRLAIKFIKYLSFGVIGIAILLLVFFGAHFLAIKEIYSKSINGKYYLEQAVQSAKNQNFEQAVIFANQSTGNFDTALNNLNEIKNNSTVSNLPYAKSQLEDIGYLLNSTEILSRSVEQAATFGNELQKLLDGDKKLTYSTFSTEEKKKILGKIYNSGPELAGMKANLDLALINLNKINFSGILRPLKGRILDIKNKVEEGDYLLAKASPMSQILPMLAGYPNKSTFLILLQNSDELRPTGGFIGTYGILQTENADITRFDTHDIYHMDMPVKDAVNIIPPEPIKKYLNQKWYMRDANWSPDWPTSAQKIEWFYNTENKLLTGKNQVNNFDGQFDGVIAITPKLVTSLLSLVGPINIDGQEYTEDNFTELLEYRVEKSYEKLGIPKWQRKEVIGDIIRELKIRLLNLPSKKWQDVLSNLNSNFSKKNILIYLKNPELENLAKEQNWAGEIKDSASDYLMIVDSNMAALKTDAVMNRSVDYNINETADGLIAKLTINYAHRGPVDWKTSKYQSFTRIYVPLGSSIIKSQGFADDSFVVQNEYSKTSFGGYLVVEPNSINKIILEYKLPDSVKTKEYNLLIQKQPGNKISELTVDAQFNNVIKSYNPIGFSIDKNFDREVSWITDMDTDKSFKISF